MARVCAVCGKGPQFGHNVSHAHNLTKRRFNPNLQSVRAVVNARTVAVGHAPEDARRRMTIHAAPRPAASHRIAVAARKLDPPSGRQHNRAT